MNVDEIVSTLGAFLGRYPSDHLESLPSAAGQARPT